MGILFVDDFLNGSGDEDVAVLVEQVLARVRLRTGESDDGTVFDLVIFQFLQR